jgi:hypothetical protein
VIQTSHTPRIIVSSREFDRRLLKYLLRLLFLSDESQVGGGKRGQLVLAAAEGKLKLGEASRRGGAASIVGGV